MSESSFGGPTSGRGQNVSFSFQPDNEGIPQIQPVGAVEANLGSIGGNLTSSMDGYAVRQDGGEDVVSPTLGLVMKLGGDILRKRVQDEKDAKYVEGMTRAMQGEAVSQIAADQPWYSTLFGESDAVIAARAYTAEAQANKTVTQAAKGMAELRKLSPLEAEEHYKGLVLGGKTGDAGTDALYMQSMTRALPSLMKQQAQENYKYLQEEASSAEQVAFKEAGNRLKVLASSVATVDEEGNLKPGTLTQDDYDQQLLSVANVLYPTPGRDMKDRSKNISKALTMWAQEGNFHAINGFKRLGVFESLDLPTEEIVKINTAIDTAEGKAQATAIIKMAPALGKWRAMTSNPTSAEDLEFVQRKAEEINLAGQQVFGFSRPILDGNEIAAGISRNLGAKIDYQRQAMKQAVSDQKEAKTEQLKVMKEQLVTLNIARQFATGDLGAALEEGNKKEIDRFVTEQLKTNPRAALPLLYSVAMAPRQYVNPYLQDSVQAPLRNAAGREYDDSIEASYAQWLQMKQVNDNLPAVYFGKYDADMERYHASRLVNLAPEAAYQRAFLDPARTKPLPTSKEGQKLVSAVMSENSSLWPEFFGGARDMSEDQASTVARHALPYLEKYQDIPGLDEEDKMRKALTALKSDGGEIVGGYFWRNNPGQKPLGSYVDGRTLAELPKAFEGAMRRVITEDLRMPSSSASHIMRVADRAGKAQFIVLVTDTDGEQKTAYLSSDDVMNYRLKTAVPSTTSTPTSNAFEPQ